jgi:hypothetical protein
LLGEWDLDVRSKASLDFIHAWRVGLPPPSKMRIIARICHHMSHHHDEMKLKRFSLLVCKCAFAIHTSADTYVDIEAR